MKAADKIREAAELREISASFRKAGRRVVFTNGCFDLLHIGHVRSLEASRALGDLLVVGVNSDASVRSIKGSLRPIIPQEERLEIVAALQCVDYVTLFDTPDPLPLILLLQPHFLVKSADWPLERIIGAEEVLSMGGEVVRVPLMEGVSTTSIAERIVERFKNEKS